MNSLHIDQMFSRIYEDALSYFSRTFSVAENWTQIVLIILAFLIGWAIRKRVAPQLVSRIDRSGMHFRLRQTLKSLTKLILPISAFLILGVFLQLSKNEVLTFDMKLASAATNLLMAWIVIRAASQLIQNTFMRQTVALIAWIIAALNIIGVMDETTNALDSFGFSIGEGRITALAVIKAILLIFALLYAAIFLSKITERRLAKVNSLTPASRVLISKIARVLFIIIALLIGVTTAGVDLSVLAVFSGALGLGIGFGLQKGVSNLFSGILLLMDNSINPGDVIEIENGIGGNSTFGWVQHMGARFTEIVTRDNKSFLIPNEDFITQQVVNWSHGDTLVRMEVEFGVHYDSDPHEVTRVAIEAAAKPERVVESQKPVCWISGFGDSSIDFKLRFWIEDAQNGVSNIKGQVFLELWDAFKANGIKIPYPHREVFVHDAEPPQKQEQSA
ncbi:MAG: mechanosensitive ion channel family protein [Micavibrio sp.]|nr:mechanosensitive ion channel family protein [Micavibrio sp.]|tara:strand:+ start:640829 stop:642166 length:1338 start_codon:yes stop_codon:yes gene_type:complete